MTTSPNTSAKLPGGVSGAFLIMSCDHGKTTCYVVPGTDERRNRLAIDYALGRHPGHVGCLCRPEVVRILSAFGGPGNAAAAH